MTTSEPADTATSEADAPSPEPIAGGVVTLAWVALAFGVMAAPGALIFIPGIRDTVLFDFALMSSNIAPFFATVSWLLAVIASLIALVGLIRRRRTRRARKALVLAAPGAVFGTVALALVFVYIGNLLGAFDENEAEIAGAKAIDSYVEKGATLICADGDNGHGVNQYPWYAAYIDAPADLGTEAQARDALTLAGYPDAQRSPISDFYKLPATTDAFEVQSLETTAPQYDGAPLVHNARVEIFPEGPVTLGCIPAGGNYGDDIEPSDGRVIVVVHLSLDSTRPISVRD